MGKIFRIMIRGVKDIGMAEELHSIYQTNPPLRTPVILNPTQAREADAESLRHDWLITFDGIRQAYEHEKESVNGR